MNAVVVNCSSRYNIAVHRLTAWLRGRGVDAQMLDFGMMVGDLDLQWADQVFLSVVFSWDLSLAVALAGRGKRLGCAVHIGGPAAEYNGEWVREQTGIEVWRGPHPCAGAEIENPPMTRTSRGCPNRCPFCIVPELEGDLVELDVWQAAPLVMDNNFLACSSDHQERAIARLSEAGFRWIDFNQGLDARLYTPGFRELLGRYGARLKKWRFAYDQPGDWPAIERALDDLHRAGVVGWWDISIYLLYNYRESPGEIVERAERVIGSRDDPRACPWPMAYRPVDWMDEEEYVAPGWTLQQVRDVRRYYSRPVLWRSVAWEEYDRTRTRSAVAKGYPVDWDEIAQRVKDRAGWRCEHCDAPHDPANEYTLTVHHLDDDPANCADDNLVALCQRCHLRWQSRWYPGQAMMAFARPQWMTKRGHGGV